MRYLSHKEFGTNDITCINTNVFLIPVKDIVRFDNDRILKVHELWLGFQKVHKRIKGTRGSFNPFPTSPPETNCVIVPGINERDMCIS